VDLLANVEQALIEHIESELIAGRNIVLEIDTSLSGIVDSSGVLELTMWIESTFGFSVDLEQVTAADFASVRSLADWIRRNAGPAPGGPGT
jgi:acyl carrier protein